LAASEAANRGQIHRDGPKRWSLRANLMETVMNTHSKIGAAGTRESLATTARRVAPATAAGRRQQLLLGAIALAAGTYAFAANTAAQADTIRHNFCAPGCPSDGSQPQASLILDGTHLYGTTEMGGTFGKGTVFRVKPNGAGYAMRYSFGTIAGDGAYPQAGLLQSGSLLFGTTYQGGQNNFGTVFCMRSAGSSEYAHYSFGASASDGTYPQAGLTLVGGWLYGTTAHGGAYGGGTMFRINTRCTQEQVLYNFNPGTTPASDGGWPSGTLYYDSTANRFYGTTQIGGSPCDCGTVFSITPSGVETVIYAFSGNPDGSSPEGGVVYDPGTNLLFGTTEYGGTGFGTVFSVPTIPGPATVYALKGPSFMDGQYPYSNLTDVGGTLYGTTLFGGSSSACGPTGCGTVFKLAATTGPLTETPIYSFTGTPDGYGPAAGVLSVGTALYGTTLSGGSNTACGNASGCGTVYSIP
jgi:uncharacterized repeat protein (TIGR03803 family)